MQKYIDKKAKQSKKKNNVRQIQNLVAVARTYQASESTEQFIQVVILIDSHLWGTQCILDFTEKTQHNNQNNKIWQLMFAEPESCLTDNAVPKMYKYHIMGMHNMLKWAFHVGHWTTLPTKSRILFIDPKHALSAAVYRK